MQRWVSSFHRQYEVKREALIQWFGGPSSCNIWVWDSAMETRDSWSPRSGPLTIVANVTLWVIFDDESEPELNCASLQSRGMSDSWTFMGHVFKSVCYFKRGRATMVCSVFCASTWLRRSSWRRVLYAYALLSQPCSNPVVAIPTFFSVRQPLVVFWNIWCRAISYGRTPSFSSIWIELWRKAE